MWRTERIQSHQLLVLVPLMLLTQVLVSCGGGTSVAVCASTGPNNDVCSGFGSSGGGGQTRAAASVATIDAPAGLYSIDTIVDRPFVDGVVLRVSWAALEPEPGEYKFEKIAEVVTAAQTLKQKVTLVIQLDELPEWLAVGEQDALSRLADALGSFEMDGILLRSHDAIGQVTLAGYGVARQIAIELWRAAFPSIPLAVETDDIFALSGISLPPGVFWLYTAFSTQTAAQLTRKDDESSLLLRACGAWIEQHAWPDCPWSAADSPDTALAYAMQQYGAAYFEFHAEDLETVDYYSQFEYWSSLIRQQ